MITRDEIARSLTGAWTLFLDRPDALSHFDVSYAGFWRSFQAIVLVAPLYAISLVPTYQSLGERVPGIELPLPDFIWLKAAVLVIDWVTMPILLALLAPALGLTRTFVGYIVVRNWGTVLLVGAYAVVAAVEVVFGGLGPLILPISLVLLAAALRFSFLNARRSLQAAIPLAVGLVVLDLLLSMFISAGTNLLVGLPAAV